ncbi:MAG TPA: efflux RND transporter permease subunit [Anaerolineales bacterium]|nr:efflux RND transporter permease subunit [Anaerolineales bacterium]
MKFQYLVAILAVVVMVVGIGQLRDMPVDVLPEFSPPYVEIQTEALGLSAEEVEQMITAPMEQDLLAGVAWADVIRSESIPGLSSVVLFFEPGTDLYRARQMVSERLSQAAVGLPHVSKPPTMIQPLSSTSRFIIVGLSSKDLSLIEMSVLSQWVIGPRLMGVPSVANVAIWGQRQRQLQVQVDPERLRAQGVSLQQVIQTTGNALWVSSLSYLEASSPGTGGFIDTPNQRLGVWHVLPISSPDDLAQVPVEGTQLLLDDVAELVEDHQPLIGDAIVNGDPNLLIVVGKLPGTNTLEVTREVEAALDALRPGLGGIEFDATLYRPATFIEMAIANLTRALVIGALLVVLILGAFLYGWRTALISLVAIPLSLVAALLALYLVGATLNTLILAGLVIALGAVIDDAIVDVEHIARRLRQQRQAEIHKPATTVVLEASAEMRGGLLFATLIIALTVLPVFFIAGETGALLRPLALSYALAVSASMLVALTVTPALSLILLSSISAAPDQRRESPLVARLQRGYDKALAWTLPRPRLAYATVVVLGLAGIAAVPLLGPRQLLPSFREPYLLIQWEGAPATSRAEMDRIVARASQELRAIPGVRDVGAHVGRAVFGDQVVGINSAQLWVNVDPKADYEATVAAVQETVDGYAGLDREVSTYLQQTLSQAKSNPGDGITVRVFGEGLRVLRNQAEVVRQVLSGISGVVDSRVELPMEEPTVEIEVDLAKAQHYGIKPGDVRRAAAVLLSGLQVGALFEEQKVFDVVVWSTPETRQSLTDIRELLIETPSGHVRLGEVADVRVTSAPVVIRREGISPYLDVTLDVQGRDTAAVTRDAETALQNIAFPLEYHAVVLGKDAEPQAAQQRILLAAAVAVIGMFLLLQASYGSWRLALIAILTMPMALAGGALAAPLGGVLSLSSLFGLLAVLGIAARNGIVMTSHFQHLELREGETFGPELVLRGAHERLAPMVLTALATALALLPLVLFGDIPGHEVVRPMAIVILGGLVTSTSLSLFVAPSLYLRFGARPEAVTAGLPLGAQPDLNPSAN